MSWHEASERPRHPFGRLANVLVWAGSSLGLIQAGIFVFAWASAPARGVLPLAGAPLFGWLVVTVATGWMTGWLCWRTLQAWRAYSPRVLGRLLAAALVLLPLGAVTADLGGASFSLAGALLAGGAVASRRRIAEAADRLARRPA